MTNAIQSPEATLSQEFILNYPSDAARCLETMPIEDGQDAISKLPLFALALLKTRKPKSLGQVYVVDEKRRLLSQVDIAKLALAESNTPLESLSRPVGSVAQAFDIDQNPIDYEYPLLSVSEYRGA